MIVKLVAYTGEPVSVCALAAKTCVSDRIPPMKDMTRFDENGVCSLRGLEVAMASGHDSLLEHAAFTFAVQDVSRALTHQLVRHRIGISFSQQSQRYVNMDAFDYVIPHTIDDASDDVRHLYMDAMDRIRDVYRELVDAGIPDEDARYILPNACETNILVTVNARELRHMAEERMCARAQWEIRELVAEMVRQAEEVAPFLFKKAGPKCRRLGYCPEKKGCGACPGKKDTEE